MATCTHICLNPSFFVSLQELQELKEDLKDTSVVVQMDNSRQLNMQQIVAEVKGQYEEISSRSRQEAEDWYKNKVNTLIPAHKAESG